jgi:hypothetical protein
MQPFLPLRGSGGKSLLRARPHLCPAPRRRRNIGRPFGNSGDGNCRTLIRKTRGVQWLFLLPGEKVRMRANHKTPHPCLPRLKGKSVETARKGQGLPPSAPDENMAPATIFVMVGHPARARMRRTIPAATVPGPTATLPSPSAADPNNPRLRHRGLDLHLHGGRRGIHVNLARDRHRDLGARPAGLHHTSGRQQAGAGKNQN